MGRPDRLSSGRAVPGPGWYWWESSRAIARTARGDRSWAAGRELDRGLEAAGIDRGEAYVTNAVKHFKFTERGARRIHQSPNQTEIKACRPWLDEELQAIEPEAVVALGAVAAKALFGPAFRVTRERGRLLQVDIAPLAAATIHPSAILRQRDESQREVEREALASDLAVLARALAGWSPGLRGRPRA